MLTANQVRLIRWLGAATVLLAALVVAARFSYLWRAKVPPREGALREVRAPRLDDGMPLADLALAIDRQVVQLSTKSNGGEMQFGPVSVPREKYREALIQLAQRIRATSDPQAILEYVRDNFAFFEVYGEPRWGEAFVTGYFEPVIRGARSPSAEFAQPLYAVPSDLLKLDLSLFSERFTGERPLRARLEGNRVVPYYSRAQIDSERVLASQGLELCWVHPVDAFFLQVQGSGVVQFDDGSEMVLGFADKNGHRYESIGRFLKEKMAPIQPTFRNLVRYLNALPPQEQQAVFNLNPSYVFFQRGAANAVTALGVPATKGRTVATDHSLFPAGALAFLDFSPDTTEGQPQLPSRLVFNQDVGGAIKGPGRVDLFFGRGEEAGAIAGEVQSRARFYFLVPRDAPGLSAARQ